MRKAKKKRNKTRSPLRTNLIFDYIYFSFILSAFPFLSSRPFEFSFSVRCYPCTATSSSLFMYTVRSFISFSSRYVACSGVFCAFFYYRRVAEVQIEKNSLFLLAIASLIMYTISQSSLAHYEFTEVQQTKATKIHSIFWGISNAMSPFDSFIFAK